MESSSCDANQLDADVLLPPRKRHLAGLKRQVSEVNPHAQAAAGSDVNEYDARHNELIKSYPNLSDEEIVVASRLAAFEAAKVAQVARATAEEKAARAARAVAAAKNAIDLVASMEEIANADKYLKKNKMKKHVEVQALYDKPRGRGNWKADEELARKLHRAINSSPRTNKSSAPESKSPKHKKLRASIPFDKDPVNYAGLVLQGHQSSPSSSSGLAGGKASDGSVDVSYMKGDGQKMKSWETLTNNESDIPVKENGEADGAQLEERVWENGDSGLIKKKGKIKQKKLPLSICSIKDVESHKEDLQSSSLSPTDKNKNKANGSSEPMFTAGASGESGAPVERTPIWKCQAFKAPSCVKQNKVMQS